MALVVSVLVFVARYVAGCVGYVLPSYGAFTPSGGVEPELV